MLIEIVTYSADNTAQSGLAKAIREGKSVP